jgi:hypothetical protein
LSQPKLRSTTQRRGNSFCLRQAAQSSSNQSQACYDAKLNDFKNGIGEEAPISNDMMNEWRSQCDLPSV